MCMNMCMYMVAIRHSEFAPDFDVFGIKVEVFRKDGVDVAADAGVAVAEDTGDAFQLRPYSILDVDGVTLL